MSVFSKLKRSRQAAKEHKSKNAEKDGDGNDVAAKVSYRHVPTHAAIDALNGTPASWKASDRPKILEQHKRRSQMNISRTPSTLSTMSIAEARTSVAPPLPRNSSYSSYNPAWFDRPGGESSSMGANMYYPNESSSKRHKPARGLSYHEPSIGRSPLSNSPVESEDVSPVISSGNSTSSQSSENLEIAGPSNYKRRTRQPDSQPQRPTPNHYAEKDVFDRLHTSTTRKVGEAPLWDTPPPPIVKAQVSEVAPQPKRQRWSLMGKKHATAVAV